MKKQALAVLSLCTALLLSSGCVSMMSKTPHDLAPVTPAEGEVRSTDEVLVIVDASGSMAYPTRFAAARTLLQSTAAALPDDQYHTGLFSFGGEWEIDWFTYPSKPFDRNEFSACVSSLRLLKGATPLALALANLTPYVAGSKKRTSVLIVSDGEASAANVLEACADLKKVHRGQLCFHTLQMGNSEAGGALLSAVAGVTGCGKAWKAADLKCAGAISAFAHDLIYGGLGDADADGDGVPDSQDECPGTPVGVEVDERGCWVLSDVLFDFDKATLRPEYTGLLDEVAGVLLNAPNMHIRIQVDGHTDSMGPEAYNQGLSERRANAVREALIQRGIEADRLTAKGFGESQPVVENNSRANRQLNRRVELTPIP